MNIQERRAPFHRMPSGRERGRRGGASDLVVRPARRIMLLALVLAGLGLLLPAYLMMSIGWVDWWAPFVWRSSVILFASIGGSAYALYYTTTLRVAEDEITKRSGIVTRNFDRIELDKITNYSYHRSFLALMLGLVDLEIEGAGSTDNSPGIIMRFLSLRDSDAVMASIRRQKDTLLRTRAIQEVRDPQDGTGTERFVR